MFQKIEKPIGVSDFRASISMYLKKAKSKPLVISTNRGEELFVVLSVDTYNKMVEAMEDYEDAMELDRLVRENKGKKTNFVSSDEMKRRVLKNK